jgi:hypothetical protein
MVGADGAAAADQEDAQDAGTEEQPDDGGPWRTGVATTRQERKAPGSVGQTRLKNRPEVGGPGRRVREIHEVISVGSSRS